MKLKNVVNALFISAVLASGNVHAMEDNPQNDHRYANVVDDNENVVDVNENDDHFQRQDQRITTLKIRTGIVAKG